MIKETPKIEARPAKPMFSEDSVRAILEAAREINTRSRNLPRTEKYNPFKMETDTRFFFPERAMPPTDKKIRMAQDTALVSNNAFAAQAWQAGGLLGQVVAEGLLFLGYPYLSELAQRPEFRLFGEIRAEEMTRRWTRFRGTSDESTKEKNKPDRRNEDDETAAAKRSATGEKPRSDKKNREIEDKIKEMKDFEDELQVRDWFKSAAAQDAYFGISHLFLDLKGAELENLQDPELKTPIGNGRNAASREKLSKNCLRGMRTIEPIWCYPTTYNAANPLLESWYDPQVWYVMGSEIHKTRLLSFIGRPVPDILKPAYAFGGLSMTQMAQPYVDIWLRTRESVGEIIHAFSVMVLSTNMQTQVMPGAGGGAGGDVLARLMLFNILRDNQGVFAIDKTNEDFKNVSAPLSGLDSLQAQAQEHMFCLSSDTLVETDRGQVRIDEVTIEDLVMTRNGFAPISWVGQTGVATELVEIRSGDTVLRATGWHPIWSETTKEFVNAENVDRFHCLLKSTNWGNTAHQSLGVGVGGGKLKLAITEIKKLVDSYIARFTKFTSVLFRRASTFITEMKTLSTMPSIISRFSPVPITIGGTWLKAAGWGSIDTKPFTKKLANSVGTVSRLSSRSGQSSALSNARALGGKSVGIESVQIVRGSPESVFNIEVSDGFLPEFFANGILVHNSVGRIPAVKFAGIQPQGLNSTSEGEMRAFNDTIHGAQEHLYRRHLQTVYDVMQISLWGKRDPDLTFEFLPLQEPTPKELEEIRKLRAETLQLYIDTGVIWQEEAREHLVNDPDSGFDGLDPEDVPDLLEEEESGLIPPGAGRALEAELQEAHGEEIGGEDAEDDAPTKEEAARQARVTAGEE